ncbi:restriction endonuclease subunit S [Vibrio sp. CUB2]|uniref:restriction endonuclease subunit S n=1 Tax=Vibrio sp. CUB2 TaxID=2315233 RepID=UPI0009BF28FC|nr:restriction endonuclease subunit S [Vibrio sp. CUB2]
MSCNWSVKKLGDLVKFTSGGTPSKSNEAYWGGDIPWISASSMDSTRYSESDLKVTTEGSKNGTRLVPEGTVLLLVRGGALHNKIPVGITTREVTFNQDVKALVPKTDEITPWYLLFWLISIKKTLLAKVENTGIGAGKLDTKILQELEVPLPPRAELKKLEKFCKALDDKIILNTDTNQTLEQMAQAIFKSWFVDFDPVKAKMNGEQPEGMNAATASLFPEKLVESELGLIPDGWNIKSIKDFGDVICGKTPSKKNADFYGGDVPFIKIPDTHGKVFITETSDTLTQAGDESQPKKRIPENSICVSCIATVGQVFITTKPSHTNQQINSVVPYDQNSLYYLFFKFKGLNKHFHDLASGGSATLNMNTSTFSKVALVRPTADVLEAFHKTVGGLMEKMLANQLENATLSELRDTLLPKLLSGEIELKESGAVDENEVVNRLLKQVDFGVKSKPRKSSIPNGHIGYITTSGTFGSDGGTFVDIPKAVQALTKITSADGTYGEIAGNALTENVLSGTVELATNNIIPLGVLTKICTVVFGKKTPIKPRNAVLLTSIHQAKNKTLDSIMNEQAKRFKFLEQSSMDEQEFGESLRYLESIGVVKCEGQHITLLDTIVQH